MIELAILIVVVVLLATYKKALKKNYKHMEYIGIIVRVKRGVYLINPNLLLPVSGYVSASALWNKLVTKEVVYGE